MRTLPNELWRAIMQGWVDEAEAGLMGEDWGGRSRFDTLRQIYARLALVSKLFNSIAAPLRDSILYLESQHRATKAIERFRVRGRRSEPRGTLLKIKYVVLRQEIDEDLVSTLRDAFVNARVVISYWHPGPGERFPACRVLWTHAVDLSTIGSDFPNLRCLAAYNADAMSAIDDREERSPLNLTSLQIGEINAGTAQFLRRCGQLQHLVLGQITSAEAADVLAALPSGLRSLDTGVWHAGPEGQYELARLPNQIQHLTIELRAHACVDNPDDDDEDCRSCSEVEHIVAQLAQREPVLLPHLKRFTLEIPAGEDDDESVDEDPYEAEELHWSLSKACTERGVRIDLRFGYHWYLNDRIYGLGPPFGLYQVYTEQREQRRILGELINAEAMIAALRDENDALKLQLATEQLTAV